MMLLFGCARKFAVVLLMLPALANAERIRVATWNLDSAAAALSQGNASNITELVAGLKRLDPDVILLQQVINWDQCAWLAQQLKPSDYHVVLCSSFGVEPGQQPGPAAMGDPQRLKESIETQMAQTTAALEAAQKKLEPSRAGLGAIAQELASQGLTNWPEVTPERAKEYHELAVQMDQLGEQERELRRRGYKEAHPLVQAVRGQLRIFSAREAELERSFPTLKFIVTGTNAPNWSLASQLEENKHLHQTAADLREALNRLQARYSDLVEAQHSSEITNVETVGHKQSVHPQVAILAKQKAYSSWTRAWAIPNGLEISGFAFSAFQTSKQRIGFFSIDFGKGLEATAQVEQLLGEISSIRKWEQNQVDTFIVACTFESLRQESLPQRIQALSQLNRAGFTDALRQLASPEDAETTLSARADWMLMESSALPLNPQAVTGTASEHQLVTCEVELDPTKVAAGRLARVEAQTLRPFQKPRSQSVFPVWVEVLLSGAVVFLALGWMLGQRNRRRLGKPPRRLPVEVERGRLAPSSYTVVVAPTSMTGSLPDPASLPVVVPTVHVETPGPAPTQSGNWQRRALAAEDRAQQAEAMIRQGLLPQLSQWLKETFLRKLLTDRSRLLAAQEEATRKVMAVDARLTRLEVQIQQQTRVYEKRIEELMAELVAAKEENRELIRAKITQVKIEMEAARKKLLLQQSEGDGAAS